MKEEFRLLLSFLSVYRGLISRCINVLSLLLDLDALAANHGLSIAAELDGEEARVDHKLVVVDVVVGEGIPGQGKLDGGGLAGPEVDALIRLELRSGAVDAAGQIIDVDLDDIG